MSWSGYFIIMIQKVVKVINLMGEWNVYSTLIIRQ